MAEQPFQVNVSDADIQLLHNKLELHRFPDELEDAGWDYGAPLSDIKRLVARWKDGYDWKKFEAKLNRFPMFTRDIPVEGHGPLNIHYIHQKSTVAGAIPLLFVHGCKSTAISLFSHLRRILMKASISYRQGQAVSSRLSKLYQF